MPTELTREELLRYNRQIIIPDIGEEGQQKIKKAKVFVAGIGGLGYISSYYMAAAGVGHLKIVYYTYCGRSDDMFKVSGRWVSPFEVESAIVQHPKVLEAAVISRPDENGLIRAEAWIVLKDSVDASDATAEGIRAFCKGKFPSYKFPWRIHLVDRLPKTPTGKVQRYKLRAVQQDKAGGA
jgi:acyl-coenzyme A synthetase/AMP-(fatty) acid ligase